MKSLILAFCAVFASSGLRAQTTGWQPAIDLRQTLRDLYEYWQGHLDP